MPSNSLDKINTCGPNIPEILIKLNKPEKNFSEILDNLYFYGQYLKETRLDTLSDQEKSLVKKGKKIISLKKDEGFRAHIKTILSENSQNASQDDSQYGSEDNLEDSSVKPGEYSPLTALGLQKLSILVTAWEDPYFRRRDENKGKFPSILYDRQHYKNKRFIDKSARHAIHAALFAIFQTVTPDSELDPKKSIEEYLDLLVSLHQEAAPASDNKEALQSAAIGEETERQAYQKSAEQALAAYRPPTKKNRAIRILSIALAILVGLIAGLGTGTAIYLLVASFPVWGAALLACAIFAVGFYSNYLFFSETLPDFFQMIASGELTQYIDKETGQRKKMGWFKKCLLVLAFICALSVGLVSAVLLVKGIMAFSVAVLPALGAAPLIIGTVLGLIYCTGLTITMFYAFVKAIKDPISFAEIKVWFKNLTGGQLLGLFIKLVLSVLVLFTIGFGCQVSVNDLMGMLTKALPNISTTGTFIASITFDIAAILSFLGQVPFAFLAVNKFCDTVADFFKNLFRPKGYQNLDQVSVEKEKPRPLFYKILDHVSLLLNAVGNAVLYVIPGSNLSKVAAVGGGAYSYFGNLSEPLDDEQTSKASDYSFKLIQDAWSKSRNVDPVSHQPGSLFQKGGSESSPISEVEQHLESKNDPTMNIPSAPPYPSSTPPSSSASYGFYHNHDLQNPEYEDRSKLLPDKDIKEDIIDYRYN